MKIWRFVCSYTLPTAQAKGIKLSEKKLKNYNFLLNEFNNSLLFFIEVAKEHHKIRALLWSSFFVGFYHSPMDHSLQTLYITIKSFFNRRQETLQQSLLSVFKRFPSNSITI